MVYIFAALALLVAIGLVMWIFVNSDARSIAQFFKLIVPVGLMVFGIIATLAGVGQFGIPAIIVAGLMWYFYLRKKPG